MNQNPARLILLLSVALLALVVLNISSLVSEDTDLSNETKVLPGTSSYFYKFYLKDASVLGAVLPGTSPTNYLTGASVTVLNQSEFHCGDTGSNYTFSEIDGLYKITCQEAGTMSIRIAKSGYYTKTTSLVYYQGEIPTITLTKYVPPPPPETIKDISLPSVFREAGSKTTDLKTVPDTTKVENLTLDTKESTIVFKEAINLSTAETKDKFKQLDNYLKMEKKALVGLDSVSLPELNKKATVSMKSLPWLKQPRILVDGKEDNKIVTNIKYEKGLLTFDVTHFSTFLAAPSIEITEPKDNFQVSKKQISLRGTVSDPTATVSAKLNGRDIGKLSVATASGAFESKIDLIKGANEIVVNALSANGATASAMIKGTFKTDLAFLYVILSVLGLIALAGAGYGLQKILSKNKKPATPAVTQPTPKNL